MNRAQFDDYFAKFNARNYDEMVAYYADDIVYYLDGSVFNGPQEIIDLYKEMHQYFSEEVVLENIAITDNMIAAEVPTLLKCRKKFRMEKLIPMDAGDTINMTCFNHYDLNDEGKIKRIRVATFSMETVKAS